MPRINHKPIQYPTIKTEYHITTSTGVLSCIYDDETLARERFATCDPSWKLIVVIMTKHDITPDDHERTAPLQLRMSQAIID